MEREAQEHALYCYCNFQVFVDVLADNLTLAAVLSAAKTPAQLHRCYFLKLELG